MKYRVKITIDVDMPKCKSLDAATTAVAGIVVGSICGPIELFASEWELHGFEGSLIEEKLNRKEAASCAPPST
jgi:hypothetical protein